MIFKWMRVLNLVKKAVKQKKYYAVKVGRTNNVIVGTWDKCKELVDHFPRAVYKSFLTKAEAEKYLNSDVKVYRQKKDIGKNPSSDNKTTKKVNVIKVTLKSELYIKFNKLCDTYQVSVDKQIERLIKEWADLY